MPVFAEGVDVVLDYLWGTSAERLLIAAAKAGRDAVPLRFVEIGSASGDAIALPGADGRHALAIRTGAHRSSAARSLGGGGFGEHAARQRPRCR